LNQGDDKSGRISRADVAALCLECAASKEAARATFECYDADTAQPLKSVGVSNILKRTNQEDGAVYVSGRECRGPDFSTLFAQLKADGA